jgi:hypothetical protein
MPASVSIIASIAANIFETVVAFIDLSGIAHKLPGHLPEVKIALGERGSMPDNAPARASF